MLTSRSTIISLATASAAAARRRLLLQPAIATTIRGTAASTLSQFACTSSSSVGSQQQQREFHHQSAYSLSLQQSCLHLRRSFHTSLVCMKKEEKSVDDGEPKELSHKEKKQLLKEKARAAMAAAEAKALEEEKGGGAAAIAAAAAKKAAAPAESASSEEAKPPTPEPAAEKPAAAEATPPPPPPVEEKVIDYEIPGDPNVVREYSYDELTKDAAIHKAGLHDPEVATWENPLHYFDPDKHKIFPEDFESEEAFKAAKVRLPPLDGDTPEHLTALAEEIVHLNLLEMNELTNKMRDHFGFHDRIMMPDDDGTEGAEGDDDDDDEGGEKKEAEPVKTTVDLKLVAYDEKSKIKVIKEVRAAVAGLGLKEAKELVEAAPKVISKGVKREEAEEIKKKLEEIGATIELV